MVNFIIPDLAGLDNSLQDSKGINNNFKTIQQKKPSQGPHLKDLSTKPKTTKELSIGSD